MMEGKCKHKFLKIAKSRCQLLHQLYVFSQEGYRDVSKQILPFSFGIQQQKTHLC